MAVLAFAPLGIAQELRLPVFDKLKEKASDVTNLTLNKNLLQLGVGFLGNDKDAAKIKKLVEGLNGIFVKSLEFDKEGAYTKADLQQLLSEVGGPGWNLIISSDENHGQEISRIWIKTSGNGEVGGMRILSAEAKELTVVDISGRVRLEDLKDLEGLGVPDIHLSGEHTPAPAPAPAKKNEE